MKLFIVFSQYPFNTNIIHLESVVISLFVLDNLYLHFSLARGVCTYTHTYIQSFYIYRTYTYTYIVFSFHQLFYSFSVFYILICALISVVSFPLIALGLFCSSFLQFHELGIQMIELKPFFFSNINIQCYKFPSKHHFC